MKLVWSQRALSDVVHLRDYIGQDSPIYARQFIEGLLRRVERLPDFPRMGRAVPEAESEDIREVVYQGYRVIYRCNEAADTVELVTVLHGSRDVGGVAGKPWEESEPE